MNPMYQKPEKFINLIFTVCTHARGCEWFDHSIYRSYEAFHRYGVLATTTYAC